MTWSDITERNDGLTIKVKSPKSGRKGEVVELFDFPEKKLCPVKAIKDLRDLQERGGIFDVRKPVFRFGSGKCLTPSALNKILRHLSESGALDNKRVSGKSFRAGIPTDSEKDPGIFGESMVKNYGRWTSSAYLGYMKDPRAKKRWYFKALCELLKK